MTRDTWLPWFIAAFFGCVIAAELAYNATGTGPLITWRVPLFAAFMLAAPVSDQIAKLRFGLATGLTIETHIAETQKDFERLESLRNAGGTNELETLLQGDPGQPRGVWPQLITYRLGLRLLLMRLCKAKGIALRTTPLESITNMLNFLQQKNLLDPNFVAQLNRIRDATYFVEWGEGKRPSNEEISNVLSQAPNLLRRLARLVEGV